RRHTLLARAHAAMGARSSIHPRQPEPAWARFLAPPAPGASCHRPPTPGWGRLRAGVRALGAGSSGASEDERGVGGRPERACPHRARRVSTLTRTQSLRARAGLREATYLAPERRRAEVRRKFGRANERESGYGAGESLQRRVVSPDFATL